MDVICTVSHTRKFDASDNLVVHTKFLNRFSWLHRAQCHNSKTKLNIIIQLCFCFALKDYGSAIVVVVTYHYRPSILCDVRSRVFLGERTYTQYTCVGLYSLLPSNRLTLCMRCVNTTQALSKMIVNTSYPR